VIPKTKTHIYHGIVKGTITFNSLNAELNLICHLLALLEAHHILHVSTIRVNINFLNILPYAAETCLKAKTVAKLNSTEMDFWRRSARISRKDKIRNNIIKQEMKVTRSLLDDIKTKQLQCYGHVQRMEEGRLPKEVKKWRPAGR
jgi:hypothetical protein